ncbi:MAG: phosphate propanoyltransferase [Patescibacteria group bacterium]
METKIPVEVSARHIHLSKEDLEKLFGLGYELKELKRLSQPSDFACEETVDIKVGDKEIKNVRVVGPLREKTQVEISKTDAFILGVNPPIMLSGEIENSSPVVIVGPEETLSLKEGLIVALRHIHCATSQAAELGLKNNDKVSVRVPASPSQGGDGERPVIFENVAIRIKDDYKLCMHLDTDEGNAAGIDKIGNGAIL